MKPNFFRFPLKTESSLDSGPQIFVRSSTPIRDANRFPSMAVATVIALLLTNPAHASTEEDIGVQPPPISVILANDQQVADGLLFVAPKVAGISGYKPRAGWARNRGQQRPSSLVSPDNEWPVGS